MAKKEIVKFNPDEYAILESTAQEIIEIFQDNFEGEEPNPQDLFIKIPSPKGDDARWVIETEDGKEVCEELNGIIVYIGNERAYFEGDYGEGETMPLCTSKDGKIGTPTQGSDEPGGSCADCPRSQFGPNGEKPECGSRKPIYAFIPEVSNIFPCRLDVTATSFKPLKDFRRSVTQLGLKFWDSEVQFSLAAGKSKNGQPASILKIERICNIKKTAPEYHSKIIALRKAFLPYMAPASALPPEAPADETVKAA